MEYLRELGFILAGGDDLVPDFISVWNDNILDKYIAIRFYDDIARIEIFRDRSSRSVYDFEFSHRTTILEYANPNFLDQLDTVISFIVSV